MKFFLAFALLCASLTACDEAMPYSHAAQKCRDLGLTVGSAEYNDCVGKFKAEEDSLRSSKQLY